MKREMKLPDYVQAWVDKKTGRAYYYFRRGGKRVLPALPGLPWSPAFMAAYQAKLDAVPAPIGAARTRPGSLDAALALYYPSAAFRALKPSTQAKHRASLERWRNEPTRLSSLDVVGPLPLGRLSPSHIDYMLEKMKPHTARNWLKAARHFCKFCVKHKLIATDPTLGIKAPVPPSDGHYTWSEEEAAQYRVAHPVGSKARLALELGLCTAQRRGDVIRMGRQHIKDGAITVKQEKTGTTVVIPILLELQEALDATPNNQLTLLVTKTGKSYGANDFSEQFRKWCDDSGLPQACVFHGLRHAALTRLAEAGCTLHELAAIGGFKSLRMVERYTRKADQARLARAAMARMQNQDDKIPASTRRRARGE
jgi:integrase